MADSFAHLHVHTEYSMLDGAARVKNLLRKAVVLGQPAVASTDHGNVFSHYEMWQAAAQMRAEGDDIKAILGVEAYVAPASRFHKKRVFWGSAGADRSTEGAKDVSGGGSFTHMTLLAANAQGLRALFEITSRASAEGSYSAVGTDKPRIDADLVAEALGNWPGAQLIGTTGCPSGAVQTRLRLGQYDKAVKEVGIWQDILGPENYFLELMDHGIDIERRARQDLMRLAVDLKVPLLATNDSHYVERDEAELHDALLCVQTGKSLADTNRLKFDGDTYYLRSSQEMRELFAELPQACDNTLAVAERVAPDAYDEVLDFRDDLLPQFPVPDGHTEASYLRERIVASLREKYPDRAGPEGIRADAHERALGYEFPTIERMGYPGYMLMVEDTVRWAREQGIRVGPGRGSAAGSLVSYALDITTVPTLEHGLLFERFINPERVSPPDVDVDFEQGRRDEVFRYLTRRWGADKVCRIQTVGTYKAKQALKDACRVLGLSFGVGSKLTAAFPKPISGFEAPLSCVEDKDHPRYADGDAFRALLAEDPEARKVFDLARKIEGQIRSVGVHACGFVVSRYPLMGRIPLTWSEKDQQMVSGFPNATVLEPMGYLKVDCLGLDTMDVVQRTVDTVRERYGRDVEADLVALDDPAAYEQLAGGHTVGLFQVGGGGIAKLLQQMRADRFEDISAALALYRPGPMGANAHTDYALRKTGRQEITPIHRELEAPLRDILGPTQGVIVYQEQVMAGAQEVAGYSLARADLLRKVMGKKKPELLAKEYVPFREGMAAKGFSEQATRALWDIFVPFSAYAFNRAHTVSYGHITYATAWLKAHYPAEFMAALLTQATNDTEKKAAYLAECRRMGIPVLTPDVNSSDVDFTAVDGAIRFGLRAIAKVGQGAAEAIVRARADKGAYVSFADWLAKSEPTACRKDLVAALIKAGAFDSLGHSRRGLLDVHADALDAVAKSKKVEATGQMGLLDLIATDAGAPAALALEVPAHEWAEDVKLQMEREVLGLYISGHPLATYGTVLTAHGKDSIAQLIMPPDPDAPPEPVVIDERGRPQRRQVQVAGILTEWEMKVSRAGNRYVRAVVEDLDASIEVMLFQKTLEAIGDRLAALGPDVVVAVRGTLQRDDEGGAKIFGNDVAVLQTTSASRARAARCRLVVRADALTPRLARELRELSDLYPGPSPLVVELFSPRTSSSTFVALPVGVARTNLHFVRDASARFGPNCLAA
ncbi:DNA polymerase III subunit alpha [Micromonospora sp. NPDC005652]|uniref:DNA polymerase III subunit alpha n=1 Tax=Micromonospora sp. NPDC005652 TaxID=3157046 RepID=UPI0033D4733C